jgi:IclR family pca regulon transcriptional regulator
LAYLGYLETDGSFYWLSSKVLRFSGSYLASARLPRVLQSTLSRLAAQTGESFSVVVRDSDEVVIVARNDNQRHDYQNQVKNYYQNNSVLGNKYAGYTPYGLHLGARLPIHATSTGRVLLAALNDAEFDTWAHAHALPRLTVHTCTDMAKFRDIIAQIRLDDFAVANQEHELGVHALAVPLRNMQGTTVAALNVVTQPSRLEPQALLRELLPLLQDAAREVRQLI